MRLLLLIVSRRRDELESQTGRHPHTRVASVIYEEELEHPRPTGVGRTRGQFRLSNRLSGARDHHGETATDFAQQSRCVEGPRLEAGSFQSLIFNLRDAQVMHPQIETP